MKNMLFIFSFYKDIYPEYTNSELFNEQTKWWVLAERNGWAMCSSVSILSFWEVHSSNSLPIICFLNSWEVNLLIFIESEECKNCFLCFGNAIHTGK